MKFIQWTAQWKVLIYKSGETKFGLSDRIKTRKENAAFVLVLWNGTKKANCKVRGRLVGKSKCSKHLLPFHVVSSLIRKVLSLNFEIWNFLGTLKVHLSVGLPTLSILPQTIGCGSPMVLIWLQQVLIQYSLECDWFSRLQTFIGRSNDKKRVVANDYQKRWTLNVRFSRSWRFVRLKSFVKPNRSAHDSTVIRLVGWTVSSVRVQNYSIPCVVGSKLDLPI